MEGDLEARLRSLARSGRLNYVSLAFPLSGKGEWEATYRGVEDRDTRFASHSDPVSALLMALTGRKPAATKPASRRPKRAAKPVDDDDEDLL